MATNANDNNFNHHDYDFVKSSYVQYGVRSPPNDTTNSATTSNNPAAISNNSTILTIKPQTGWSTKKDNYTADHKNISDH